MLLTLYSNNIRTFSTSSRFFKVMKGFTQSQWRPQIPKAVLENAGKEVAPGIMPHKMACIYKIHPMYNLPNYEKAVLKAVGLGKNIRNNQRVVVKNTATMCKLLWQIKHLIRVVPLKFPNGLPTSEDDIMNTKIREDGTVNIIQKIRNHTELLPQKSNDLIPPIPEKYTDIYMSGLDCRKYHRNIWV